MEEISLYYVCWFIINVFGFGLMGLDKQKARKHQWRISEKMLWLTIIIGGSIGSYLGMKLFHHKTKHLSFKLGVPIFIVLHVALAILLSVS
nr:DUF1294 domain-containing protein [Lentibacillus sp. Marseille-P4043]